MTQIVMPAVQPRWMKRNLFRFQPAQLVWLVLAVVLIILVIAPIAMLVIAEGILTGVVVWFMLSRSASSG